MCGGRSSILYYGPLIETNYLYAPTPNGQSPSASLNKSIPPDVLNVIALWTLETAADGIDKQKNYNHKSRNTERILIFHTRLPCCGKM